MTLEEFFKQTRSEMAEQMTRGAPYAELVFAEIVMQHLAEIGMSFEPAVCHYEARIGNSRLRLTGYAFSEENDQLDLFVSLYSGAETITQIHDSDTKRATDQCLRFLAECANGRMAGRIEETHDAHSLALNIQKIYNDLEQIRIFVLTDGKTKSKTFKDREISGKTIKLEVMDMERLFRHCSEGKPRDELIVELKDSPLPCVYVTTEKSEYDYALTAIPGETLRGLYEKFGSRLLEANVRSFLKTSSRGVNAGIQKTLRYSPENFMAYNNGIVLVADEIRVERAGDGSPGIIWLRGIQIVNGGQTTASMFFTKKNYPVTDLSRVRVPVKIIILKQSHDSTEDTLAREESLISDISRYANSQNSVNQAD
ncbi:MAG: AIPR family protein, partial [Methylococcaceae bacterium]